MHEASIVESLVQLVQQHVPAGARTRQVAVKVGRLTGVSPDAMRFYFDILKEDTLGPQAELVVTLEPLRAECRQCGQTHLLDEVQWSCPACGAPALAFLNGDELHLASIEVEDGQDSIHRAAHPEEEC